MSSRFRLAKLRIQLLHYLNRRGLLLSILFLMLLTLINALLNFHLRNTAEEYDTKLRIINKVRHRNSEIIRHVNIADLGFRGFMIIPNDQLLQPYTNALNEYGRNIDSLEILLHKQGYEAHELDSVRASVRGYMKLVGYMVELKKKDKIAEIEQIVASDPGYEVWITYKSFTDDLLAFEDEIYNEIVERYEFIMEMAFYAQVILLLLSIPTLILMIVRIIKSQRFRDQLFSELDRSNRRFVFDRGTSLRTKSHEQVIINITSNLKYATRFVQGIGKGELNQTWEGLSETNAELNEGNIAGELIRLQQTLRELKEKDHYNLWINEGLSMISEVMRRDYDTVEGCASAFLTALAKYAVALQGVIYLAKEDEVLQLSAVYAYDKSRERDVMSGEGYVGQCYRDVESITIKDIPGDYARIQSGLGGAAPRSIYVFPIVHHEQCVGVLELSFLEENQEGKTEFIGKTTSILGSALSRLS